LKASIILFCNLYFKHNANWLYLLLWSVFVFDLFAFDFSKAIYFKYFDSSYFHFSVETIVCYYSWSRTVVESTDFIYFSANIINYIVDLLIYLFVGYCELIWLIFSIPNLHNYFLPNRWSNLLIKYQNKLSQNNVLLKPNFFKILYLKLF
jgi:hypothetical protein